jgi:hypothetical protein
MVMPYSTSADRTVDFTTAPITGEINSTRTSTPNGVKMPGGIILRVCCWFDAVNCIGTLASQHL